MYSEGRFCSSHRRAKLALDEFCSDTMEEKGLQLPNSCIPEECSRIFLGIQTIPEPSRLKSSSQASTQKLPSKKQENMTHTKEKNKE